MDALVIEQLKIIKYENKIFDKMIIVYVISVLLVLSFFLFMLTEKNDFQMDNRQYSLFLRGVAIMLVVVCHCMGQFTRIFTPFGGIGVALFLILSGYGLNESFRRGGGKILLGEKS